MIPTTASGTLDDDAANLAKLQCYSCACDSLRMQYPVTGLLHRDTERNTIVYFGNDVLTGTWRDAWIDDDDTPIRQLRCEIVTDDA